jgi:DNA-binding FrmR family transcriptional regulator
MTKKEQIITRLNRAAGQIEALTKQVADKNADCTKVFLQFKAAQAAFDKAFAAYVERNLKKCIRKNDLKSLDEVVELLTKK